MGDGVWGKPFTDEQREGEMEMTVGFYGEAETSSEFKYSLR